MDYQQRIIGELEILSFIGIKACFEKGIDPNGLYNGKPLIYQLIGGYSRGPAFRECFRTFVDYGLALHDKALLAVFLDDYIALEDVLMINNALTDGVYTFPCAFTSLFEVSLLHICAEFNHQKSAQILIKYGAAVNVRAGYDEYGFGGQTPIFHTVNQHANKNIAMLQFLLSHSPDLNYTVKGLIWGKGYDWETFIPAVNPISYAMMGLLPQFHRKEKLIYEVISMLLKNAYTIEYRPPNVPNRYLYE